MSPEALFRVLGDGLSIISLSLICSTALTAWRRIPKAARIPMQWNPDGTPGWRTNKALGLLFVPVMAIVLLLVPTLMGATRNAKDVMEIVTVFAVRALAAAGFCGFNLFFLKNVYKTLEDEGTLER